MKTKIDTLEARVLAEVRQEWTPSEATLSRLGASLDARIHDPGRSLLPDPTASPGSLAGVKALLVTAVTSACVAFAAGYWLGQASSKAAPEQPRIMAPQTAPEPSAQRPQAREAAPPVAPEKPRDPSPVTTPPNRSNSATPHPRALAPGRASAEVTYKDPLDAELDLLRRVEHSLRQGNGRLAMALLGELDKTVPQGQLLQERAASHIMANCINRAPPAKQNAAQYLEQNGKSPFAGRVRALCGLERADTGNSEPNDGLPTTGD